MTVHSQEINCGAGPDPEFVEAVQAALIAQVVASLMTVSIAAWGHR
jgi:hypothetical protein